MKRSIPPLALLIFGPVVLAMLVVVLVNPYSVPLSMMYVCTPPSHCVGFTLLGLGLICFLALFVILYYGFQET